MTHLLLFGGAECEGTIVMVDVVVVVGAVGTGTVVAILLDALLVV